jgi:hypothetical protein
MYCKFLKLTNGEDIIVTTDNDCTNLFDNKFIDVNDPVVIKSVRMPYKNGIVETFVMHPWIKMAKDGVIKIPSSQVIVATDLYDKAETQYKEYVISYKSYEEAIVNEMYNEEQEDETLEEFYSMLDNQEDDEDDSRPSSSSRTLH